MLSRDSGSGASPYTVSAANSTTPPTETQRAKVSTSSAVTPPVIAGTSGGELCPPPARPTVADAGRAYSSPKIFTTNRPSFVTQPRNMPVVLKGVASSPRRPSAITPPSPPRSPTLSIAVCAASSTRIRA